MSLQPKTAITATALLCACLLWPSAAWAGGAIGIIDPAGMAFGQTSWTIDSATAADNGPASGSIQEGIYGKIQQFKARLPDNSVVDITEFKLQMSVSSDVAAIKNGDHLEWYLGVSQLSCDSSRWNEGLPTEFFAAATTGGLKVVTAANPGTYVTAKTVTIEWDPEDTDCP